MRENASNNGVYEADKVVQEARERFTLALSVDRENRNAALEDINFIIGEQWDEQVKLERTRDGRPTLILNRLRQFVNQVVGEVRRNTPAIKCDPGDGLADVKTAHIYEGLIRSIERRSRAKDAYVGACEMAVIAGIGHFRLALKYLDPESFDLEPVIEPIRNIFSVVWDPEATQGDFSDARYCFVYQDMDKEAFRKAFPNAPEMGWDKSNPHADQRRITHPGAADKVTVCEYWCVKEEPAMLVKVRHDGASFDDMGNYLPASGAETVLVNPDQQMMAEAALGGWRVIAQRETMTRKVCMYLLAGNTVLETVQWPGHRIPVFSVIGEQTWVKESVVRHGLIRWAKDAQRLLNWARSSQAEHAAMVPKSQIMIAAESIKGFEEEWRLSARKPTSHVRYHAYDDDGNQLPVPRRPDPISTNPAISELAGSSIDDMKAGMGIYDASIGNQSRETSGVAIEARNAQSDTGTFVYLDNLFRAMEACGRELVAIIPKVYSAREQVRILGADDAPAIVALAEEGIELDRGKYDVVVKTGPAFETRRAEARANLTEFARSAHPVYQALIAKWMAKLGDWDDAEDFAAEIEAVGQMAGLLPPPPGAMPPGAPQLPPGMASGPEGPPPGMAPVSTGGAPALSGTVGPRGFAPAGPAGMSPGAM